MKRHIIPDILRAEDTDILSAFKQIARIQNLTEQEAEKIFNVLPESLKNAPAFKDRMTGIWRYEYGTPYTVGNGIKQRSFLGTDQAAKVSVLFNGIRVLHKHVSHKQLKLFCKKIESRNKHLDFLSELDPIMRPNLDFTAVYEPDGYGRGNKKIDWLIKFEDGSCFLIDVKNRIKALLKYANNIVEKGVYNTQNSAPSPNGIFKSSEIKFLPAKKGYLQGIWLLTSIYYDDKLLHKSFNKLKGKTIQFAVLTHFEGKARILTKNEDIKSQIIEKFCLVEMEKR